MVTETEPETTQQAEASLKDVLSTEAEEVSEEAPEEAPEDKKEETKESEKPEDKPDPKIEARIQAEADKRSKGYQEKREADTALIRRLQDENRELKRGKSAETANSLIKSILSEDEENGLTPEQTKSREQALKEFVDKYDKNYSEVEQSAQTVTDIMNKIPPKVVKAFELDDPNPTVRAVNISKLVNEAATYINESNDFLMAIEEFFPKGDEVRKQLDEIVKGMTDFESEKAKKLYLADRMKGLKVTPRKKPPAPSSSLGGTDISKLSGEEKIAYAIAQERRNRK